MGNTLNPSAYLVLANLQCNIDFSNDVGGTVMWRTSSTGIQPLNEPLYCINDKHIVVTRNCTRQYNDLDDLDWFSRTNCNDNLNRFTLKDVCAENFERFEYDGKALCFLLTKPKPWTYTCSIANPFFVETSRIDQNLYTLLQHHRGVDRVWLPARRSYDFGPMEHKYTTLTFDIGNNDTMLQRGCLSMDISNGGQTFRVEDCELKYPILCMYSLYPPSRRSNLIQDSSSLYVCDGSVISIFHMFPKPSFNHYQLSDIGLCFLPHENITDNITDLMLNSNDVDDIVFEQERFYQLISDIVSQRNSFNAFPKSCRVCHKHKNITELSTFQPRISLTFTRGRLFAVLYHSALFWDLWRGGIQCFVDSDYESTRSSPVVLVDSPLFNGELDADHLTNTKIKHASFAVYEVRVFSNGYYKCQGHVFTNLTLIESTPILVNRRTNGTVFAVQAETHCNDWRKLHDSNYVLEMAQRFSDQLNYRRNQLDTRSGDLSIEKVNVMRIIQASVSRHKFKIVFHVTVWMSDSVNSIKNDLQNASIGMLKMKNILTLLFTEKTGNLEFQLVWIRSTEFCLPESNLVSGDLTWDIARIGDLLAPNELCLLPSGLPVRRHCVGDFIFGGTWHIADNEQPDCDQQKPSALTRSLYDIEREYKSIDSTSLVIRNVADIIRTTNEPTLIPADFHYLGQIMQKMNRYYSLNDDNVKWPKPGDVETVFDIYNSLMAINDTTTNLPAAMNATNVLLKAFDNFVNSLTPEIVQRVHRSRTVIKNTKRTLAMVSPKLIVYVLDPLVRNISGLALIRKKPAGNEVHREHSSFLDFDIRLLHSNQSVARLLDDVNLEIASFVPPKILNRKYEKHENIIIITVYFNSHMFQDNRPVALTKPGGMIISVSMPGYRPILPGYLPIFVRPNRLMTTTSDSEVCGNWDFTSNSWSQELCELGRSSRRADSVVMCVCSDFTHSAFLQPIPSEVTLVNIVKHKDWKVLLYVIASSVVVVGILLYL